MFSAGSVSAIITHTDIYLFFLTTSTLQIGAAWNICQRHFDNPAWSQSSASLTHTHHSNADDDIPLDEELWTGMRVPHVQITIFFQGSCLLKCCSIDTLVQKDNVNLLVFSTCLIFTYFAIGHCHQRWRYGVYTFSGDSAASQQRQVSNFDRQRTERESFEERMRDLGTFYFLYKPSLTYAMHIPELEIEEARELERTEKEKRQMKNVLRLWNTSMRFK